MTLSSLLVFRRVVSLLLLSALVLGTAFDVAFASPHQKQWQTATPIGGGGLLVPSSVTVAPNSTLWVGVEAAGDTDYWVIASSH